MNKIIFRIWIIVFMCIIIIPLIIYPFISNKLDNTNYENRTLITYEKVKSSSWSDFFPNLEIYIEDYLPYKNLSVSVINWIDEYIFNDEFNASVMVGKNNWLFYKGNDCIQDYRGSYTLEEEELQEYLSAAERLDFALKEKGIDLCIMITPNKEAIYGNKYLPGKVVRYSDYSRADQIVKYLEDNTDITIVYPKESLQEASEKAQVWKKYDTHWNNLGAFVASQNLLEGLGMDSLDLEDVSYGENGLCSGDLANMLGKVSRYSDDTAYIITDYKLETDYEQMEFEPQSNLSYVKYESSEKNGKKVLFIGDSFLGGMQEYLAKNFETTMFVHRDNYGLLNKDLINDENPDIVVMQTSERFLQYFAYYMNSYADK